MQRIRKLGFMHGLHELTADYRLDYSNVNFLAPSMHCNAHGHRCKRLFHPDRNPVVGRIDGEACERCWSNLSKVHSIVKNQLKVNRTSQLQDLLWHQVQKASRLHPVKKIMDKFIRLNTEISYLTRVLYFE
jgi:hypothetical protein